MTSIRPRASVRVRSGLLASDVIAIVLGILGSGDAGGASVMVMVRLPDLS